MGDYQYLPLLISIVALLVSAGSFFLASRTASRTRVRDVEHARRSALLTCTSLLERLERTELHFGKSARHLAGTALEGPFTRMLSQIKEYQVELSDMRNKLKSIDASSVDDFRGAALDAICTDLEVLSRKVEHIEREAESLANENGT